MRNLDFLMKSRGIENQSQLADRLKFKRATVNNWFRNKASPDMKTIGKIAALLRVPVRELFVDPADARPDIPRPPEFGITTEVAVRALVRNLGIELAGEAPGKH